MNTIPDAAKLLSGGRPTPRKPARKKMPPGVGLVARVGVAAVLTIGVVAVANAVMLALLG